MATKIVYLLVFIFAGVQATAQSTFYKSYGDNGYDTGNDVIQVEEDSSYYIVGSSSSNGDAPSQVYLLHVDKFGDYIGSYFFGGIRSDVGVRVLHKPGEGFWLAGYSNSFNNEADYDFYLIKLNESFEVQWEKTYGTSSWEILHDAILLPDGGVLMVGEANGPNQQRTDGFVIRTDADGEMIWQDYPGGAKDDWIMACTLFDENSFLLAGRLGNNSSFPWLARYDLDYNEIWKKGDYLATGSGIYNEVRIAHDLIYLGGHYIEAGQTSENTQPYRVVCDLDGELVIQHIENSLQEEYTTFDIIGPEAIFFVLQSVNPSVVSSNGPFSSVFRQTFFLHYGGFSWPVYGNKVSSKRLIKTLDEGRYALVGTIEDPAHSLGGSNAFLFKSDTIAGTISNIELEQILTVSNYQVSGLKLFPNPSKGIVKIAVPTGLEVYSYQVMDFSGRELQRGLFQKELDLQNLGQGVYFLSLDSNQGTLTTRIVIE